MKLYVGLLVGAVARGAYEARIRELIEHCDPIFVMLDAAPRGRERRTAWTALL